MKYIIFENNLGYRYGIIFGEGIKHSEIIVDSMYNAMKPISAGFVSYTGKFLDIEHDYITYKVAELKTYGKSDSLKLKSEEFDSEILMKSLFLRHGVC